MVSAYSSTTLAVFIAVPLALLAIAYRFYSAKPATPVKVLSDVLPTLPDPSPMHSFDLRTARTRDHIVVNKTLRHPYFQTMYA